MIIRHPDVEKEPFPGGAFYQTLVGDGVGSTPVRCGIQTSPPGYETPDHSHPYMEILTVLEGHGEAWMEGHDDRIDLAPEMTLVFPAGRVHGFRVTGDQPLKTYGVHVSPDRIVEIHQPSDAAG